MQWKTKSSGPHNVHGPNHGRFASPSGRPRESLDSATAIAAAVAPVPLECRRGRRRRPAHPEAQTGEGRDCCQECLNLNLELSHNAILMTLRLDSFGKINRNAGVLEEIALKNTKLQKLLE